MPRMFFGSVALIASCATLTSTVSAAVFFGTQTSCGLSDIYPNGGITNGSFEFAGSQGTTSSAVLRDPTHADSDGSGPFNRGIARADATLTGNLTNAVSPRSAPRDDSAAGTRELSTTESSPSAPSPSPRPEPSTPSCTSAMPR